MWKKLLLTTAYTLRYYNCLKDNDFTCKNTYLANFLWGFDPSLETFKPALLAIQKTFLIMNNLP